MKLVQVLLQVFRQRVRAVADGFIIGLVLRIYTARHIILFIWVVVVRGEVFQACRMIMFVVFVNVFKNSFILLIYKYAKSQENYKHILWYCLCYDFSWFSFGYS